MNLLKPKYIAPFAIILYAIYYIPLGELVNVNNGLGWDGKTYASIARNISFSGGVTGVVPEFRFLPSTIVHYLLILTGASFSNANIRLGFQLFDAALLVIAVLIFCQVLEELGHSIKSQVFACICLILNFCFLKWSFWYPILTDQSTFFLATLLLYFYVKNNTFWLLITSLVGYLTNPALFLVGGLLLASPRESTPREPLGGKTIWVIGASFFLAFILLFAWFFAINTDARRVFHITGLAALAAILFASIGFTFLVDNKYLFSKSILLSKIKWDRLFFCMAFYFIINRMTTISGTTNMPGHSIASIVGLLGVNLPKPFVTIAAFLAFYGPVVALCAYYWKRFSSASYRIGVGFHLVIAFGLMLLLLIRPRQFMAVYPFYALGITEVFSKNEWRWGSVIGFGLASLVLSRFWQPLNKTVGEGVQRVFYMNYQVMGGDQYRLLVVLFLVVLLFAFVASWRRSPRETQAR